MSTLSPPGNQRLRRLAKIAIPVLLFCLLIAGVGVASGWNALALGACGVIALLAVYFRWEIYSLLLALTGRGTGCDLRLALAIPGYESKTKQIYNQVAQSSRPLQKDPESLELWQTGMGRYWIPQRGQGSAVLFDMLAEFQLECYGGKNRGVQPGDVVLDCGANVGVFVRESLDAGAKLVIASEPSPQNLVCLKRNFAEEIVAGRVIVFPKGLWHEEAELQLGISESPAGDSFIHDDHQRAAGPVLTVTTIDSLVNELGLKQLDFIKMDIEGAERNALSGGAKTITKFRPRLAISAYHLPDDPPVITQLVDKIRPGSKRYTHLGRLLYGGLLHSRIAPLIYFFED